MLRVFTEKSGKKSKKKLSKKFQKKIPQKKIQKYFRPNRCRTLFRVCLQKNWWSMLRWLGRKRDPNAGQYVIL
jgi:hypothetical protein